METCGRKISDLTYLDNAKNVPKLPVPTLEETVERLLKSIKPLFSEEEYEECKEKAEHLLDPTKSIGRTLQRRLEERASDPNIVSWAEEWWNDVAYFQNRQSLCFYVNYFFAFRDIKVVDGNSGQQIRPAQTKLAAVLLRSILEYRQEIIDGTFKTDTVREKILCMKQFMYQFGGCRIPGEKVDTTKIYPFEESKHIAVSHKGKFYTLDPYNEDGSIKPIDQLEHMLLALVTWNKSYEPVRGKSIGVLSTLKRGDWYRARKTLLSVSEKNKKSLKMLESSAFLLSLDSNTPETYDELANACYHSDGINGYFDKCFQLLVFKNGRYGFNGEHSLTDGTTDVRLANHIVTFAEDYFTQNEYMVASESS
ncbi:Carnitine O-acetyltransferase, mitochondrial, partial [Zancudomyces culisetae]